jgi:TRAP-type transport system periplasmic protein
VGDDDLRVRRRRLKRSIAALVLVALAGFPSMSHADEPVTLRLAIPGTPAGSLNWTMMYEPWIAKVERESGGTLKLQPFIGPTIATLANVYDRVVDGAADLGIGSQGSIGGKFPGSSVVELPSDITGREGAAAFWKIYADGLIAPEYREIHLLALDVYPQSFLSAAKPIARLAAVQGLKIATLTRADAEMAQRLGAAPISSSPGDAYQVLQHGAADGVIIGWSGALKLKDVVDQHLVVGLGSGGGFIFMNKDAYAKLPPRAKAALDKNTGYQASMDEFGAPIDRIYSVAEAQLRALPSHRISALDPADAGEYEARIARPMAEAWEKRVPNGAAIFAAYRAEVARLRGGTR